MIDINYFPSYAGIAGAPRALRDVIWASLCHNEAATLRTNVELSLVSLTACTT